ncbi:MAG: hypothetical protein AMS23_04740 [Bacteroides sp. SM1_62]|nr:MAG: hypothetical protein AMS26_06235 [Bacteroides sp. SM23_62]KPL25706.1 MAG: hypothetical protein AMS23_04740 [Bacteroides sp. SM1_62]
MMNFFELSKKIARRLIRIFLKDKNGKRPVFGSNEKFQSDPYWQDHILFYEYFNLDPSGYLKTGNSLLDVD